MADAAGVVSIETNERLAAGPSGGKFVVACAWKIPQRLTHATVVSGNAPLDLPGVKATLSKQDNQLYGLADKAPWLLRVMLWKIARDVRKNPASVLSLFTAVSERIKRRSPARMSSRSLAKWSSSRSGRARAAQPWN